MTRPDKAFILAAGMGTRLRPHTDRMPKPMVAIAGKSIIRRTLQKLADEGVSEAVVNTHHLAPVLEEHLRGIESPRIVLSPEETLLETGGGIKKALHHFEGKPFYILNGDALWDEGTSGTALGRLAHDWDDGKMDILLLLQPVAAMNMTGAVGDYTVDGDGRAKRSITRDGDYMFAGIRIAAPRIFDGAPEGAFSFLSLMDKAEREGRLFAVIHDGGWYHISTPEDLAEVDAAFRARDNDA